MEEIFRTEEVHVEILEELNAVKITWLGIIPLDVYQSALVICKNTMAEKGIGRILVDQTMIKPLSESAEKWLYKVWFPELIKDLGTKIRIAILPSYITFRTIASKSIAKRLLNKHQALKIEYFQTEKNAKEFLMAE